MCFRQEQINCEAEDEICIASQRRSSCHACGLPGCWSLNATCLYFGKPRPNHSDSQADGHSASDIFERPTVDIRQYPTVILRYQAGIMTFRAGFATGAGNNCLIDTLCQCVHHACAGSDARDFSCADCIQFSGIRGMLCAQFSGTVGLAAVTYRSHLDFCEHAQAVLELIGESARRAGLASGENIVMAAFTLVCVARDSAAVGDVLGSGSTVLYLVNEGNYHYRPLLRSY